jgi:glyceraldehyde 3-phosphate dehydrogenase
MITKIAINGLGRIGRAFLKMAQTKKGIEIVAVNDLGDLSNLAYLLKYDTAYGRSGLSVETKEYPSGEKFLVINGKSVRFFNEKDPMSLPWGGLGIDVVVESTGFFTTYEKAKIHLDAGAKRVVISAPVKGDAPEGLIGATVLMGINEDKLAMCQISSNASCTTNSASPVVQILHEAIGIEKAMLSTVHGYTTTQKLVDSPDAKDFRRGRAGAANIVPSTTGAADAVTQAITELEGKFDGLAFRVPVITGSIADITFVAKRATSVEEVNNILREAAKIDRWKKIFSVTDEPLVSSDIVGQPFASIADLGLTKVVAGDLVKVCAWYDNETGYTAALMEHVIKMGSFL